MDTANPDIGQPPKKLNIHQAVMRWHAHCYRYGMQINGIKVADWAVREHRKQVRESLLAEFFAHVRLIFVFLFVAAVLTFVFNRQTEIRLYAATHLAHLQKPNGRILKNAEQHQQDVDSINQKIHDTQ